MLTMALYAVFGIEVTPRYTSVLSFPRYDPGVEQSQHAIVYDIRIVAFFALYSYKYGDFISKRRCADQS